jgi:hypothetical protein
MNPTMTRYLARQARCAGFGMGMRIGGAVVVTVAR